MTKPAKYSVSRFRRKTLPNSKPWGADGNAPEYIAKPADPKWTITNLLKLPRPVTASVSVSMDRKDNTWLYLGTGRYLATPDKTNTDQNYLIGIKDPFFNPDLPDCNYTYPAITCEINKLGTADNPFNDLFDADEYTVYGRSDVVGPKAQYPSTTWSLKHGAMSTRAGIAACSTKRACPRSA